MKKFKFNLEAVHKVRRLREETELSALAKLREEVTQTETLIEEIESARLNLMQRYLDGLENGTAVAPAELDLYSRHFASLERKRIDAEAELKQKRIACTEQVAVLSTAARDVKVTETLKDKKKALHDLEHAKQEQIALDEITGAKYARQMNGNEERV